MLTADVCDLLVFFGLSQYTDNLFGAGLSLFYQTIP